MSFSPLRRSGNQNRMVMILFSCGQHRYNTLKFFIIRRITQIEKIYQPVIVYVLFNFTFI